MKRVENSKSKRKAPAPTSEAREQQLISLAVDCVEERMRNGTASAQEYVHFLKLASQKQQLELEKIRNENELLIAKKQALDSSKRTEEMYARAINAMRSYAGVSDEPDDVNEIVLGID
jgi:hypothetical protein